MRVAFVILNWNQFEITKRAIESILRYENSKENTFVVVDNGSNEEIRVKLVEYFRENKWNIFYEEEIDTLGNHSNLPTLILNSHNYGYAKGNNIGLKYVKRVGFRYAFVMNNDVILTEKVSSVLIDVLEKNPKGAVVGPKVVGPDGKSQGPFWKPGLFDYFLFPVFYPLIYPLFKLRIFLYNNFINNSCRKNGYVQVYRLMGCFMLIDLEKIEKVGWFDENTFLYAEELILSEKLKEKGYKTFYTNSVEVFHEHEISTKNFFGEKRLKMLIESDLYYFKTYRGYGKMRISLIKFGRWFAIHIQQPVVNAIKSFIISIFSKE